MSWDVQRKDFAAPRWLLGWHMHACMTCESVFSLGTGFLPAHLILWQWAWCSQEQHCSGTSDALKNTLPMRRYRNLTVMSFDMGSFRVGIRTWSPFLCNVLIHALKLARAWASTASTEGEEPLRI